MNRAWLQISECEQNRVADFRIQ